MQVNIHKIIMQSIDDFEKKYGVKPHRINIAKPTWNFVNDKEIRESFPEVNTINTKNSFVSFSSKEKERYKHGGESPIPLYHMNVFAAD